MSKGRSKRTGAETRSIRSGEGQKAGEIARITLPPRTRIGNTEAPGGASERSTFSPNALSRRRWDRNQHQVALRLDVGPERKAIEGYSEDVSLNGIRFRPKARIMPPLTIGTRGVLTIQAPGIAPFPFPFRLIRRRGEELILTLEGKEAVFGQSLTQAIFAKLGKQE